MGKLIIHGNSVYEIDEDCYKKTKIPTNCDVFPNENEKKTNHTETETMVRNRKKEPLV